MITLFTAMPGSGKTAFAVDALLDAHKAGRAIYACGLEGLKVPHTDLSKEEIHQWHELVPEGALIVIDEVQDVWRPAHSTSKVPPDIAALEVHRHRGIDFILTTQHPGLLHPNVRRLVGRHIHLRDNGFLGRYWYEAPEAFEPSSYRSVNIKRKDSLPKRAFDSYKSASLHVKPKCTVPPMLFVVAICAVLGLGLTWRSYATIAEKISPPAKAPAATASAPHIAAPGQAAAPVAAAASAEATRPVAVGCISMPSRCTCIDGNGWPMIVKWEVCELSARTYAGIGPRPMWSRNTRRWLPASTPGTSGSVKPFHRERRHGLTALATAGGACRSPKIT